MVNFRQSVTWLNVLLGMVLLELSSRLGFAVIHCLKLVLLCESSTTVVMLVQKAIQQLLYFTFMVTLRNVAPFSVAQAKCLETGETVAIKKVLQDKRYKNRELQTMRLLDHPNVISLKHCFFSTTEKDELYLNLVLEYVPETVHRVIKHYNKLNQRMPLIYVKLYTYQVSSDISAVHCFLLPGSCVSVFKNICDS